MKQLLGLHRADAAIVGGGLTGLLLGASLSRAGLHTAILEAGDAPRGPTREAAFLGSTALSRVMAVHGPEQSLLYASALQTQLRALLEASLPYVHREAVYTYALCETDLPELEKRHAQFAQLQLPVHIAQDAGGCPFPVELSQLSQGAVIDMPRWMSALTASIRRSGGTVYHNSRVVAFDGARLCTAKGALIAPLVVLATGKPLSLRNKRLLALLESRTIASCTMTSQVPLHSVQHPVGSGVALCPTPTGVIASIGIGRTGSRQQQGCLDHFSNTLRRLLPDCRGDDILCAQQVYSMDGLPVIGSLPDSRMLCASGFGDCGILGAMHAVEVLTRRILGRALPEDALYAPDRTLPQAFLRREMQRLSAIRMAGMLCSRAPSCSHCGCRTRYFNCINQWGCPLCGTTYDILGQPVSGPGMAPLRVSPRQRPD